MGSLRRNLGNEISEKNSLKHALVLKSTVADIYISCIYGCTVYIHCRDESIYQLNVSLCGLLKNKFKTMLESKSTPRIYPPYPVVKTRRSNYDPVLELYYYKSIRCRLRGEKTPRKKSLQESMGAWGQS